MLLKLINYPTEFLLKVSVNIIYLKNYYVNKLFIP